jgi:hypothetical protein
MAELSSQPISIQSVYGWYSQDKLYVNRRYQRKLVWTLEEKQKLVESILRKYPVPAILVAEREESTGTYEIIDGLQRLHAIVSFVEGAFPTLDGMLFNLEYFPTAKSRAAEGIFEPIAAKDQIAQGEVSTFLDYSLSLSVMRNASDKEVDDVFDRINTYGHRLSDQERRQAGVQNDFSEMVRDLACTLRGDASAQTLLLSKMPSISIDLPMTKHGYSVKADEVFWVTEGILRATDLRDSMDEQCIADIAACIVGGQLIERSKDALDAIYSRGDQNSDRIIAALDVYGSDRVKDEIKFCVDEILKVCDAGKKEKLREVIFDKKQTNAFPSVFAVLLIAFHELVVDDKKKISDYDGVKKAIHNLANRVDKGRKATSPEERRKNINTVKGLVGAHFIDADPSPVVYGGHSSSDIDALIRRSEIELSDYELKQGMLRLSPDRTVDSDCIERVLKSVTAIANNGPERIGKVILGVTDKPADAERVKQLDQIEPKKVGKRLIVGVNREANTLGITVEQYVGKWRDAIRHSGISEPLKSSILSHLDYNSFFGFGLIVITVPAQSDISYFDGKVYYRAGDSTQEATSAQEIAQIAKRF